MTLPDKTTDWALLLVFFAGVLQLSIVLSGIFLERAGKLISSQTRKLEKGLEKNFIASSWFSKLIPGATLLFPLLITLVIPGGSLMGKLPFLAVIPVIPYCLFRLYVIRRRRKILSQLPLFLDLLETLLKTGASFIQALNRIEEKCPQPLRDELRLINASIKMGSTVEEALEIFRERVPSEEAMILSLALGTTIKNGANVTEMVGKVKNTLVMKERMERKIKSQTSQGKLQGMVISILPPLLVIAINTIMPGYMNALTGTKEGKIILSICGALMASGWMMIWKITRPEV